MRLTKIFLAIMAIMMLIAIFSASLVEAAWWNTDWAKRKEITITNNDSAQTNYQVKINVTYDSDMQANFGDIRFTTSSNSLLDYWLQDIINSSNATAWVEVDALSAGNTTIYMYYGNAGVNTTSNGTATFLLFDDFNDGTIDDNIWTEVDQAGGDEITETGGVLQFSRATNDAWDKAVYSDSSFTRSNLSFEFDYWWRSNNAQYDALMMGWKDDGVGVSYTNFVYGYYNEGCSGSCTSLTQTAYEDGTYRGAFTGHNWVVNQSYDVRVRMKGGGGAFYDYSTHNGSNWTNAYDSSYSTESTLHVGWPFYSGVHEFDNARVRKWMTNEPTVLFGTEEQAVVIDSYYVETYGNITGKARSFFAVNESIRVKTNGTFTGTPTITITDSAGVVQVNSQNMSSESGAYFYNYTLNGSQGWYNVKINTKTWEKMFYQSEIWLSNWTDNSSNAFTFRRRINISEPNIRNRWFEPIDIPINFTYLPNNNSVRVVEYNGTHMLEIPSQLYEYNQTESGLGSARLTFLSTINMSENKTYFVVSSKVNYQKNYTTDMINTNTSNQYRIDNSYFISFFNTSMGGLMQDVFNKLGNNNSLSGTEPIDYYPEFQIGLTTYSARSDTTVNMTIVTGPVISVFNVSGQASDVDSKPYTVVCKIYSKNFYMICEKNQTTTATENWKNFYINGLISSDGKYTNASYRNSTDHVITRTMASGDNSDTSSLDNNMKWIAFYSTSSGDGVAELFLNNSFSATNNPSMDIIDDADNDYYRHLIISSTITSVPSGSPFYTKTARMIYNGLQQWTIVNKTYDNLLNPLTALQDPEQTNDNTNPRYSNTGNVSGNDTSNATIHSTWEDDSFLDYATINITGTGINGTSTSLYYNATYQIRNGTSFVNQSDVNITLTASQINAGEIRANITVYDVSGKQNSTLISFNVTDTTAPAFELVSNSPSTNASLDPNVTITVTTNITEYTSIDRVVLYWRYQGSEWNQTNMTNTSATFYTKAYTANFTPDYSTESNYSYYIWSNDSLGQQSNSTLMNLSIFWDYTWLMSSTLTDSNGNFATNVSIGNLTINSTADFAIRLSFTAGTFNDRIYFNASNGQSYIIIDSNTLAVVPVNATARPAGQTEGVDNFTITVSNSSTSPASNTTNFLFTTSAGGPYLYTEITQYNATVTQGDGNITLTARVTNRGNETATNVNITFSVPSGWSARSGYSLNSSPELSLAIGSSTTFTTYVDVSSSATAGTQTITTNSACSENRNGTASVTVTVNALSSSSSSTSSSSGGGAAGGGVARTQPALTVEQEQSLLRTVEKYELISGRDNEFILEISNPLSGVLQDVHLTLAGFLSQYISAPNSLGSIAAGEVLHVKIKITAPSYFTKGTYELNFTITGIINDTQTAGNITRVKITNLLLTRTVKLVMHTVSRNESAGLLNESTAVFEEMKTRNYYTKKIESLLKKANELLMQGDYEAVADIASQISKVYEEAEKSSALLGGIKEKIAYAEDIGASTPGTLRLTNLAVAAMSRGDYAASQARLKEAELTYALETKGYFNLLLFLKENWVPISAASIILVISCILIFFEARLMYINRSLKNYKREESILLGLMKTVQTDCFEKKKMSMEEYTQAMQSYESRLSSAIQKIVEFETIKSNFFRFGKRQLKLMAEREKLLALIRQTQDQYMRRKSIETRVYEGKMKSYTSRLSEVEEQIALEEARHEIKKKTGKLSRIMKSK